MYHNMNVGVGEGLTRDLEKADAGVFYPAAARTSRHFFLTSLIGFNVRSPYARNQMHDNGI
jgi:hypothetical protein